MITKFKIFEEIDYEAIKKTMASSVLNPYKEPIKYDDFENETNFIKDKIIAKKYEIDKLMIKLNNNHSQSLYDLIYYKIDLLKKDIQKLSSKLKQVK